MLCDYTGMLHISRHEPINLCIHIAYLGVGLVLQTGQNNSVFGINLLFKSIINTNEQFSVSQTLNEYYPKEFKSVLYKFLYSSYKKTDMCINSLKQHFMLNFLENG